MVAELDAVRIRRLRAAAAKLRKDFGRSARQKVENAYPLKRGVVEGRKDIPETLVDGANALFARLTAPEPLSVEIEDELLGALLYLINSYDIVPDNGTWGYTDDAELIEDVRRRLHI